ncbi:MAG: hypothetical protein PSX80_01965 [bacterium]|nr:hypothetical protein [bacterium]
MELLIPGLILVALMVWASTRIKKNAAAAFDAETVENDLFLIRKPEGFLHVLNDDSGLAFRSYSKEFGKVGDKDVRRATIEIERNVGTSIAEMKERIEAQAESVASFETYLDGGEKAAWLITGEIVDGCGFETARKLVTRGGDVWEARGTVLSEHRDEMGERIEAALDSVRVK